MTRGDFTLAGQMGERFLRLAARPSNIGTLDNPTGRGTAVGQCGDSVEVFLQIDEGVISDIRVLPHGCVYTLVCASAMSEMVKGRTLDEALYFEPDEIAAALGGLPDDHMHCARLAVNTLGEAIADCYKNASPPESDKSGGEPVLLVLLATSRREALFSFAECLSSAPDVCVEAAASGAETQDFVRSRSPHLVIVDAGLPDTDPLDLIRATIHIDAMVNTAVVSPLSEEDFHEKSEGLGILHRLPPDPGADDAKALLQKLRGVLGMGEPASA